MRERRREKTQPPWLGNKIQSNFSLRSGCKHERVAPGSQTVWCSTGNSRGDHSVPGHEAQTQPHPPNLALPPALNPNLYPLRTRRHHPDCTSVTPCGTGLRSPPTAPGGKEALTPEVASLSPARLGLSSLLAAPPGTDRSLGGKLRLWLKTPGDLAPMLRCVPFSAPVRLPSPRAFPPKHVKSLQAHSCL